MKLNQLIVLVASLLFLQHARGSEPPAAVLLAPVASACISSPFGPRFLPGRPLAGTFHSGIDLPAALGAPVKAVSAGRLLKVQRRGVGGLEILIQHDGFVGVYSHLGLVAPAIAEGARKIHAGEKIGSVGRSGLTYGPHLYFGMLVSGKAVDPAPPLHLSKCDETSWRGSSAGQSAAPQLPTLRPRSR